MFMKDEQSKIPSAFKFSSFVRYSLDQVIHDRKVGVSMRLQKRIDERELSRQDVSEESGGGGLERAKKPVLSATPGLESLALPW